MCTGDDSLKHSILAGLENGDSASTCARVLSAAPTHYDCAPETRVACFGDRGGRSASVTKPQSRDNIAITATNWQLRGRSRRGREGLEKWWFGDACRGWAWRVAVRTGAGAGGARVGSRLAPSKYPASHNTKPAAPTIAPARPRHTPRSGDLFKT